MDTLAGIAGCAGDNRPRGKSTTRLIQKAEVEHLETFKKAGLEITTLTPAQRAEFEKASRPVYDWYTAKFGNETLDLIKRHVQAK